MNVRARKFSPSAIQGQNLVSISLSSGASHRSRLSMPNVLAPMVSWWGYICLGMWVCLGCGELRSSPAFQPHLLLQTRFARHH